MSELKLQWANQILFCLSVIIHRRRSSARSTSGEGVRGGRGDGAGGGRGRRGKRKRQEVEPEDESALDESTQEEAAQGGEEEIKRSLKDLIKVRYIVNSSREGSFLRE